MLNLVKLLRFYVFCCKYGYIYVYDGWKKWENAASLLRGSLHNMLEKERKELDEMKFREDGTFHILQFADIQGIA